PIGTQIAVVRIASTSVWTTAWCRTGLCSTELTELPKYHLVENPCHVDCDAPLLNENRTAIAIGTIDQMMYSHVKPSIAHGRRHGFARKRGRRTAPGGEGIGAGFSTVLAIRRSPSMPGPWRRRSRSSGSAVRRASSATAPHPGRSLRGR